MIFPGYPFTPKTFAWEGERLSYVDVGAERSNVGPAIVLLHGNPTWSYLYRRMIPRLAQHGRVIAPDLIGFGLSSKPTDPDAYSFERHVASIQALLEHLGAKEPVLVGQDWGGPIASRCALALGADGLVLMNTHLPGLHPRLFWFTLAFRRPWSGFLIRRLDLFRATAFRYGFATRPPKDVLRAYRHPHRDRADRAGIVAFPRMIPPPGDPALARIDKFLRESPVRKLILFGDRDPVFPQTDARDCAARLNRAEFRAVPGAGHFLQEDQGEAVAEEIAGWLAR